MTRWLASLLVVLALLACGKYGPPIRGTSDPAPPTTEEEEEAQ